MRLAGVILVCFSCAIALCFCNFYSQSCVQGCWCCPGQAPGVPSWEACSRQRINRLVKFTLIVRTSGGQYPTAAAGRATLPGACDTCTLQLKRTRCLADGCRVPATAPPLLLPVSAACDALMSTCHPARSATGGGRLRMPCSTPGSSHTA